MNNIDEIMDMLDWHNSKEIQQKGRELAKDIRCINVFLQPGHPGHGKNVWDNCALILAARSDDELNPYILELLEWLEDMNWPGAETVWNRLLAFEDRDWLEMFLKIAMERSKCDTHSCLYHSLLDFQKEYNSIHNGQ